MSVTAALHIFRNQGLNVLKKIGHIPSGGHIVKSHTISVFIMFSCWISSRNRNHLSSLNGTETP